MRDRLGMVHIGVKNSIYLTTSIENLENNYELAEGAFTMFKSINIIHK